MSFYSYLCVFAAKKRRRTVAPPPLPRYAAAFSKKTVAGKLPASFSWSRVHLAHGWRTLFSWDRAIRLKRRRAPSIGTHVLHPQGKHAGFSMRVPAYLIKSNQIARARMLVHIPHRAGIRQFKAHGQAAPQGHVSRGGYNTGGYAHPAKGGFHLKHLLPGPKGRDTENFFTQGYSSSFLP